MKEGALRFLNNRGDLKDSDLKLRAEMEEWAREQKPLPEWARHLV